MVALAVASAVWTLAGLLIRPRIRACAACGFRYAFDGLQCDRCGRRDGVGCRLLAAALWPGRFLRRVRELRALPPLNSVVGPPVEHGLATGFLELDDCLSGLRPGCLYGIAGRPSMGRTSLAFGILRHVAGAQGKSTLLFTPEMAAPLVETMLQCSIARVGYYRQRSGRLSAEERGRLAEAAGALRGARIAIDDTSAPRFDDLQARVRRSKDVDLVVIDDVHRVQDVPGGDVARALKALAVELNLPILVTAPVDREVEERESQAPMPGDVRDAGSLAIVADALLLLYRPEYYDPDTRHPGLCEVIVSRNRWGPQNSIELRFQVGFGLFEKQYGPGVTHLPGCFYANS